MYETRGTARFFYSYDSNGVLYSVKYTLSDSSALLTYYFTHNSRGDIIGIYNGSGELRAHYEYDTWGNVISITDQNGNAITNSTHIGNLNPFRYRGYYYDSETGLYYLMSRYYDPVTHRFVNADLVVDNNSGIIGNNLFAYVANSPINSSDPTGYGIIKDIFNKVVRTVKKTVSAVKKAVTPVVKNVVKTVSKYVINPVVQATKKATSYLGDFTYSHGGTITGSYGASGTISLGTTMDTKGNIGIIITGGVGGGTPSISITAFDSISTSPSIYEQKGWSAQMGGSGNVYKCLTGGLDFSFSQKSFGITTSGGVGFAAPFEIHAHVMTSQVYGINVYDAWDSLYNYIMIF